MKIRLITLFLSTFFILSLGNIALASEKTNSTVNNFETLQLSNDVLFKKALQGELINNKHTQVTVTENKREGSKTIDIEKILSEEVLPNGDLITKHTKESTLLIVGAIEHTRYPPSYSVGMRVRMDYDARKFEGLSTRKMTKYTLTPLQLDSQFQMTYYEHQGGNFGVGWMADGKHHSTVESTSLKKVTDINYNLPNSNTTNFVQYTPLDDVFWAVTILTYQFSSGW